jgi:hypothetical protein
MAEHRPVGWSASPFRVSFAPVPGLSVEPRWVLRSTAGAEILLKDKGKIAAE